MLVLVTLTFIQGHRSTRKQKLLCQLSRKAFNQFWWNLAYCWDSLVWWTLYSFYLLQSIFKRDNPTCVISLKKTFTLACIWTFTVLLVLNLVWWCHQTLHFDASLDDLDFHSRSQLYEKSKTSVPIISQISRSAWMKFSVLPKPVGSLTLMLNVFHMSNIQVREPYLCDSVKYTFSIGVHWYTGEPICFKPSMMLDMTRL